MKYTEKLEDIPENGYVMVYEEFHGVSRWIWIGQVFHDVVKETMHTRLDLKNYSIRTAIGGTGFEYSIKDFFRIARTGATWILDDDEILMTILAETI